MALNTGKKGNKCGAGLSFWQVEDAWLTDITAGWIFPLPFGEPPVVQKLISFLEMRKLLSKSSLQKIYQAGQKAFICLMKNINAANASSSPVTLYPEK